MELVINVIDSDLDSNPEEQKIMNDIFKCPTCGAKENLKKQKPLGQKPGTKLYFNHHECESGHRFHTTYSTDPSHPRRLLACDCPN